MPLLTVIRCALLTERAYAFVEIRAQANFVALHLFGFFTGEGRQRDPFADVHFRGLHGHRTVRGNGHRQRQRAFD